MHCKLIAIADGHALSFDPTLLELMQWTTETVLEVRTDGESIVIGRANARQHASIDDATQRMMEIHADTLRELAK